MTHTLRSVCVLILLQLCRAQDQTDDQPVEWYQAKVVTDDYSPQPIQEIFSTAKPLPSEPIVVLPTGATAVDDEAYQVQGLPSPTPEQQSTVSSSPLPPEYTFTSTFSTQAPPQKEFISTIPVKTTVNSSPPTFVTTNSPTQMPAFVQNQPVQYVQSGTIQLQNQTLRGIIFPLYQPQVTINNQETTPIRTSTTPVAFNTMPNQQTTVLRTTVPRMRTTLPQTTVSIQPRPTIILSPTPSTLSSTPSLQTATATVKNFSLPYPLTKIRVVAPSGSITNIKFVSSTTKSPPTTRTTRTPRTPRTRNTYKGCLDTCGKKTPICATPLAKQMNIDSLKGFPSICHMACHNSFKNNRYEKVIDGRCGKLRTHIRTLGSKKKLKKEDLQKNQYTVVKDNNNAIVEFESLF